MFINPKTDFAFKKIFGSKHSHDILISFLNGILCQGKATIVSLIILDPYQAPRVKGMKDSFLDIKATLSSGQTVIIEMQVLNILGFVFVELPKFTKTVDELKHSVISGSIFCAMQMS